MSLLRCGVRACVVSVAVIGGCFAQTPALTDRQVPFLETLRQAQKASQAKHWPEAVALWERVTKENRVTGDFWLQLAHARYEGQDYRGAITAYDDLHITELWDRCV